MKRKELHWVLIYAAIVAVVTTLPYLVGYSAESDESRFTGFVFGIEDGNSYIAKMLTGSEGAWLFRSPYSSMEQNGVVAFLPYILLGKLAAGPGIHEQLVSLYHLFRILVTPIAVYATYAFISLFIKERKGRQWATVLSTIGGGLGWLPILFGKGYWFGSFPMDWISPEWFGFLAYLGYPHLILARSLLFLGLTFYISSNFQKDRIWKAGLCFLTLGLVHPLGMAAGFAIIGTHQCGIWIAAFFRKSWKIAQRWLWIALRIILIPLPLFIYYLVKFSTDPYLKIWTEQNRIHSPHPLHILFAYGVVFLPAILGVYPMLKARRWTGILIVAWLAAFPVFAYAPHNLQRRLPEGIWVAWAILAGIGLRDLGKRMKGKVDVWKMVVLGLSLPTTLLLLFSAIQVSYRLTLPVFRPGNEIEVFKWLRNEAQTDSVVLSSYGTGNAMPAWAPVKVVVGHGPETAGLRSLLPRVEAFYSGEMELDQQLKFVEELNIAYVFWGPLERKLGDVDLSQSSILQLKFEAGEYQLFEVGQEIEQ